MNSRIELATALEAQLPKRYRVIPKPKDLDKLEATRPVVMVIRTDMRPATNAGTYVSEFSIWVIEPKTIDPEDDLDDALDAVLLALDMYAYVTWSRAERSTYLDHPAYRIEATVLTKKVE